MAVEVGAAAIVLDALLLKAARADLIVISMANVHVAERDAARVRFVAVEVERE